MKSICLIFFLSLTQLSFAQDTTALKKKFPFVKYEKNKIENDSLSLLNFYLKLDSLEKKLIQRVVVLHIGDSHLQADYFPGKNRISLQEKFGNAGRGLVTPFKVAKTNEPDNYKSWSNKKWRAKRVAIEKDTLPIGLSGLTLFQDEPGTQLRIKIANSENLNYSFNKINVIQETRINHLPIVFCDSFSCKIASIENSISSKTTLSSVSLNGLFNEVTLIFNPADSLLQNPANLIYGLIFENGNPGILYHTVGINGAEFRHYLKQVNFIEQTALVNPDLIIFSMGTNEAFNPGFKQDEFYAQIDSLTSAIKSINKNTSFLFTTPGDAMRRIKYKNPRNKIAGKSIIEFSLKNNHAYWNLFEIMGGYGSIQKWYVKGLTSKDKLHLNRKGYELQGALLSEAIMNGYRKFKSR